MNPVLFTEASRAVLFALKHYPPSLNWEDPFGYFAWYISQGYMAMVLDDEKRLVGLCTARPVTEPGDGAVAYWHDPEGDCLFIDLCLILKGYPLSRQGLRLIFQQRFGHRDTVAYFRGSETKLKVHKYDTFQRHISRTTREIREDYAVITNGA